MAMTNGEPELDEFSTTPWFPVGTVFVLVAVVFVVIFQYNPVRASSLTLTVPVVGQMTPANATVIPTVIKLCTHRYDNCRINFTSKRRDTGARSEAL